MPSENPDEASKRRWGWVRRRRWWVMAVLLLIGIGVIAWKLSEPQVVFLGFREKNGKRVAAFRMVRAPDLRYGYRVLIRNEREQWWHVQEFWDLPCTTFTVEALTRGGEPLTERFQLEVCYVKLRPAWIRYFSDWIPKSPGRALAGPDLKVIRSEMITP